MWAHYTHQQRGFVVGFDTNSDFFRHAIADRRLRKVDYQRHRVNSTRGLPNQPWVGPDAVLWTKSTEWEYEEEWRWIESSNPDAYDEVVAAPNGELVYLRHVPEESICEIVLGYRADSVLVESIEALKSTPTYKHLQLFKVALNESYYKLELQ
jgi:hypothetical protein